MRRTSGPWHYRAHYTHESTRSACHSDADVSGVTQDAANTAARSALVQHAAEGKAALAAAMEAQAKAAQAATDKTQRLLVAALLRHQKANEAAAAATLRTEDARVRVASWHQHRAGLLGSTAHPATPASYSISVPDTGRFALHMSSVSQTLLIEACR